MTKSIKQTFNYSHKPEAVWDYLTKPELIAQWLMPTDFKPVVGHEFNFTTRPLPQFGFNGIIYCKVIEVIPFKKLVYSWKGGPGDGVAFTLDTIVTWVLNPTAKGTELHLEQSGFKDENITAFTIMDAGWNKNIARVDELITQKEVKRTWHFSHPLQEVWDYLTKPELIEKWLMKTDFKPVAGQKFQFINGTKIDAYCQVLEIIPLQLLVYSWRKGKSEQEITIDSVVTWTLTEKNGGTELQVKHNGFKLLDDVFAHSKGWDFCMNRMIEAINSSHHANTNA